jgi:hypothetical protein
MGCGCGGAKRTVLAAPKEQTRTASTSAPTVYDVIGPDGSTLVASATNPVLARAEARRSGGTVVPRQATPATSA